MPIGKRDSGKVRLDLLPTGPLKEIARAMEEGANKYGDWDWLGGRYWYNGRMVESHYGYRNVPTYGPGHYAWGMNDWAPADRQEYDKLRLFGVKPDRRVEVGCPPFKTQKL